MIDEETKQELKQLRILERLADKYIGIGSTPQTAFAGLTEDLMKNRLDPQDFSSSYFGTPTPQELLNAIGLLLAEIRGERRTRISEIMCARRTRKTWKRGIKTVGWW